LQKVAYEAPPGLKRSIQRSLTALPATVKATAPKLQALLCWFHAVAVVRIASKFRLVLNHSAWQL
jgi:hypothetical protein